MADGVPDLRGGHFETLKWIFGLLLTGGAFFGGIVWQAARYPDRSEFNEMRTQYVQLKLDTSHRLDVLDGKMDLLLQGQGLETKVDYIIQQQKKGHER